MDSLQGGTGTSTNMNINEVIAKSQSTNDVYPTASINLLREVNEAFAQLQTVLQEKENEISNILKLGRQSLWIHFQC